ncbi:MAG TPA: phosphate ABC transporter permease subunit PstC [Candidatus Acidoferrales bacterium]|nr:phosphate ABC transporter permease subunit PstC [Candidatus Acidoferrales bacterium]
MQVWLRRLRSGDTIAHAITLIFASSILLITTLVVYELWIHSTLTRAQFGWHFFYSSTWDPISGDFGAWTFIYGTLITTVVSLVIAVPLGVGAAIFLSELAPPKISKNLSFIIDLLAAVPSVIYGLLAVFALVPLMRTTIEPFLKRTLGFLPLFKGPAYGVGFLTASIVLAVMIVPYIISVSREVLLAVPQDQREASLGLGATKWETTWKIVVSYAGAGIMGSVFLSMARALGETMAVTMVIGNQPKVSASLLSPGYSIAAVIANEFAEAAGNLHLSALIELGLVLFALTLVLNGLARLLIIATSRRGAGVTR